MKRLKLVVVVVLAILTALTVLAACNTDGTPAPSGVEIDIDHHGHYSKPRTKVPSAPRAKTPNFRKPSTGRRR
ncbi:hypothetical protein ACGFZB_28660 [Streptomyces cinerochromogenes]|uniref:Lipoprotein n=1 Tax=Streptomyces cinerochromogenes TaxID=66422 RepID=A0ABW7BBY3_9ACTN